jgi:electron transfer flavoprotein beta subunit
MVGYVLPRGACVVKFVVCIKQVVHLEEEIQFTADGCRLDPDVLEGALRELNEWDACATEEALQVRDTRGEGEVVVVSVGDEQVEESIRRCLAMGADRGVRVNGEDQLVDPVTVARMLAPIVAAEVPDLVFTGAQSSDSVQGATGAALAGLLGLPCVAVVKSLEYDHDAHRAGVRRELEGGTVEVVEVATPALLAIQTGINRPRYATFRAIKQAQQKEITVVEPDDIGGSACHVRQLFLPARGEGAEMLTGDAAEIAKRIAEIIKQRLS